MNLNCKQMDLWQTPTHITYMCYSNADGGAKGIFYRYEQWMRSHLNGVVQDVLAHEDLRANIADHLARLKAFPKLDFFVA